MENFCIMKKTIILLLSLSVTTVFGQIYYPSSPGTSSNNNIGIGTASPAARLQINGRGNTGTLLLNTISEFDLGGGPGSYSTSDYILKANFNGAPRLLIETNGQLWSGINVHNYANADSWFNVDRNLGVFYNNNHFFKINYSNFAYGKGLSLLWYNAENNGIYDNLAFRFGTNNDALPIMTLSPTGHVTITNNNPNINTATPTKQTYGLSIVNNGWRNHDYAFSVTTGQGKLFTISNGGTVHIGQNLNFEIPSGPYKLYVEGGVRTESVRVDVAADNGWADYVFEED